MAVTLTGFKGGATQTEPAGVDALRQAVSADKVKANDLLVALRDDLRNKTGVVRLLHTSDAAKDMKFQNSGALKKVFLSGEKLQRSGQVIHDLLTAAGLPPAKAREFQAYVQARGHSGVKAQVVLEYIDSLRVETGSSPEEALYKFGVNLAEKGRMLGKGGYGEVHIVSYRGQEFVYKQSHAGKNEGLGALRLADASGKPIVVKPREQIDEQDNREPSFKHVLDDAPSYQRDNLLMPKNPLNNEYNRESSESSVEDFRKQDLYASHPLMNFMLGQLGVKGDIKRDSSVRISDIENKFNHQEYVAPKPQNPQPVVRPPLIVEEDSFVEKPIIQERSKAQEQSAAASGHKLAREGVANASRVKDLPQVITPSVYVVKETPAKGEAQFHAVSGPGRLKDWARTQSVSSKFEVAGLLMPKAVGKQPVVYKSGKAEELDPKSGKAEELDPPPTINVSRSDLKSMATSSLSLLKGLASHGFIHGDIKPENLIWNSDAKNLQLIDNDSLNKVSKHSDQVGSVIGTHTQMYLNPVAWTRSKGRINAQLGLGRDLFAVGMVMLETSLGAKGRYQEAEDLMNMLTFMREPLEKGRYLMSQGNYKRGVEALKKAEFAANSIEAFARSCITKSIEYEETRRDNEDFKFERYSPNNGQHLLAQLERELAQVR